MLDQKHLFKHKKKFLNNDSIKGNKATDDSSRSSQKKPKSKKIPRAKSKDLQTTLA